MKKTNEYKKLMKVLGIKRRDGRLWVNKMYGISEERTDDKIAVKPFIVEPAYVNYSEGATINVGNYQSVRIDVGISLPCYVEEIDDAFIKAKEIVSKKIDEEIEKIKNPAKAVINGINGNDK